MLPGPDAARIANAYGLPVGDGADHIRNEPVFRPIAAAKDIAGAGSGDDGPAGLTEERVAICIRDQLGASLGRTIRIGPAKPVDLAIAPGPFAVGIAFVAGHHNDAAQTGHSSRRVEHDRGADDIGVKGSDRIGVGSADESLRRHMNHDMRVEHRRRLRQTASTDRMSATWW